MTHKQPHALLKLAVAALAVALSTALPGQLHSSSSQASTSGRETGAQSQFVNQDGVTIGECSYLDEQGREIKVGFIGGVFFVWVCELMCLILFFKGFGFVSFTTCGFIN